MSNPITKWLCTSNKRKAGQCCMHTTPVLANYQQADEIGTAGWRTKTSRARRMTTSMVVMIAMFRRKGMLLCKADQVKVVLSLGCVVASGRIQGFQGWP
jgi:hypothetical protein